MSLLRLNNSHPKLGYPLPAVKMQVRDITLHPHFNFPLDKKPH